MNVYSPNGEVIISASYPNRFTVSDFGIVELSTTIDKDIYEVMLKIHFTDLDKKKTLSNEVSAEIED